MNRFFFFLMLASTMLFSCKKKKTADAIPKLMVTGVADTVIIAPSTVLQYTASPAGTWSISSATGGTVDNTGKFTAGAGDGVYTLSIINALDIKDTVRRMVIVTKHAAVFNGMKSGGYLLSFRHAAASTGADQFTSPVPNWWKSCDPALARQITDPIGYRQSDSTGYVMKLMRLPFDTTMTSEYCRCKQTPEYFNLGVPNKEYQALTYYVYDENNRYANTMALYASKAVNAKNYISVTHAGYTTAPSPAPMATLNWGDCAVFKLVAPGTQPTYVKTITVEDWVALARR
ncbi:MAG: hypothetical protein V4722_17615 [Bacteroidota bacterium]